MRILYLEKKELQKNFFIKNYLKSSDATKKNRKPLISIEINRKHSRYIVKKKPSHKVSSRFALSLLSSFFAHNPINNAIYIY